MSDQKQNRKRRRERRDLDSDLHDACVEGDLNRVRACLLVMPAVSKWHLKAAVTQHADSGRPAAVPHKQAPT